MSGGWDYPLLHDPSRSIWSPPPWRGRCFKRWEPLSCVSLDEAVLHLRLDPDAVNGPEKPLIEGLILAATRMAEQYASIAIMEQDWRITMSHLPIVWGDGLPLSPPPVRELLRFRINDIEQDRSLYRIEMDDRFPAVMYPIERYWPSVAPRTREAIEIIYRCGHEKPEDVSPTTKQAILMAIGTWYENRESSQQFVLTPVLEIGWKALLDPVRQEGFA